MEVRSAFVTEPILQKALLENRKEVFYPEGLMERQIQQILDCVSMAVSRESQDQHSFTIA